MKQNLINVVKRIDRKAALFLEKKVALHVMREGEQAVASSDWYAFKKDVAWWTENCTIEQAASSLVWGFTWYMTPQGEDYWNEIYNEVCHLDLDKFDMLNLDN